MTAYFLANKDMWTGRKADVEEYWYQKIELIDLSKDACPKDTVVFIGYPNDEGVARNQGRIGASKGPEAIRKMMGSMAWHLDELRICDGGDIASDSMETAQDALAKAVEKIISAGSIPIVLGGGHDLAYGHFKGVYNSCKSKASVSQKIGIVNFDAHFDLRPVIKNGNSGTPFYQIAQLCQEQNSKFDYLALGIQKAANTKGLFDKANELKVNYVLSEQINFHNKKELEYRLNEFIAAMDHIYLSIDLDGFSSAFAPGVSAPSPLGFAPDIIWFLMSIIAKSKKLVSVEIVELNPMYDIDNSTSRLAARLIHHLLSQL